MTDEEGRERTYPWLWVMGALLFVLAFALTVYQMLEAARPSAGLISISFLVLLPIALTALLAFLADPWRTRTLGQYFGLSGWLMGAVLAASVIFLREGTVCIIMLIPIWLPSSLVGAWLAWKLRGRVEDGKSYCAGFMLLPLVAMTLEAGVPAPTAEETVTRSAVLMASPERLWPLLEGIPDVKATEGRWNVSQDVIGLPRPSGAYLKGEGIGADRYARWEHGIRFREKIIRWEPAAASTGRSTSMSWTDGT